MPTSSGENTNTDNKIPITEAVIATPIRAIEANPKANEFGIITSRVLCKSSNSIVTPKSVDEPPIRNTINVTRTIFQ